MRILVLGGTDFARWDRYPSPSEWPYSGIDKLPASVNDRQGLGGLSGEPSFPSFGFHAHGDRWHLILRRLNADNRGGYPYTILLDPGRELWGAWGWNPARLLHALLSQASGQGNGIIPQLYDPTRNISIEQVESALRDLPKVPIEASNSDTPLGSCWLRAWLERDEIAGHESGTPKSATSREVASGGNCLMVLAEFAGQLDRLPAFIRMGVGWIYGGNAQLGHIHRVPIALNPALEPGAGYPNPASGDPDVAIPGLLQELGVAKVQELFGATPCPLPSELGIRGGELGVAFRFLNQHRQILNPSTNGTTLPADSAIQFLKTRPSALLDPKKVAEAMVVYLDQAGLSRFLSSIETDFRLGKSEESQIPEPCCRYLDRDTVLAHYSRPGGAYLNQKNITLSDKEIIYAWTERFQVCGDDNLVAELRDGLGRMTNSPESRLKLISAALCAPGEDRLEPEPWRNLIKDRGFSLVVVQGILRLAANSRRLCQLYLDTDVDPSGSKVRDRSSQDAGQLVDHVLAVRSDPKSPSVPRAKAWLEGLAKFPLRSSLSMESKRKVLTVVGDCPGWSGLRFLFEAFEPNPTIGDQGVAQTAKATPPPHPAGTNRPVLTPQEQQELNELIEGDWAARPAPRLGTLRERVELSYDALDALAKIQPRPSLDATFLDWVKGWDIDNPGRFSTEIGRLLDAQMDPADARWDSFLRDGEVGPEIKMQVDQRLLQAAGDRSAFPELPGVLLRLEGSDLWTQDHKEALKGATPPDEPAATWFAWMRGLARRDEGLLLTAAPISRFLDNLNQWVGQGQLPEKLGNGLGPTDCGFRTAFTRALLNRTASCQAAFNLWWDLNLPPNDLLGGDDLKHKIDQIVNWGLDRIEGNADSAVRDWFEYLFRQPARDLLCHSSKIRLATALRGNWSAYGQLDELLRTGRRSNSPSGRCKSGDLKAILEELGTWKVPTGLTPEGVPTFLIQLKLLVPPEDLALREIQTHLFLERFTDGSSLISFSTAELDGLLEKLLSEITRISDAHRGAQLNALLVELFRARGEELLALLRRHWEQLDPFGRERVLESCGGGYWPSLVILRCLEGTQRQKAQAFLRRLAGLGGVMLTPRWQLWASIERLAGALPGSLGKLIHAANTPFGWHPEST